MSQTTYFETPQGRNLAYCLSVGQGPTIVFLSGLKSDMLGTKALHLEEWAGAQGRSFLRFDYSGHGESSGIFDEGAIGDWHEDTLALVDALIEGPIVAVGSSMGGWQALLLAKARTERLVGLVTIAAAPDFTEDGWWAGLTEAQKTVLEAQGKVELPSDYMEPYIVTRRMIEDGRKHLVLRSPLNLPFPTRLLQGTADTAVSTEMANRLLEQATGPDIQLTLIKDADHRFSEADNLTMIETAILDVLK